MKFDTRKLQSQIEENPLAALGVLAGVATAGAKLMTAVSQHRNSKVWKKEVQRRINKTK